MCYKNVTFNQDLSEFLKLRAISRGSMVIRVLTALVLSPFLFSCSDEGTISYKEKMPPAIPGNLQAVPGSQQITLTWDAVSNASSYRIYWDTKEIEANLKQITDAEGNPNTSLTVQTIADNVTNPYVHTGRTTNQKYFYRVAAFNQAGSKGLSAEASETSN